MFQVTEGTLKKEIFAFEPDDLYIFNQNMGHCKDMSNILMAGEEVNILIVKEEVKTSSLGVLGGKATTMWIESCLRYKYGR